jgi:hypothetical protein
VHQLADQAARVLAVDHLGHRAQRPGQPQPVGDDRGQLDRRRGDQPHPLAGVEVLLRKAPGAGPDAVGHELVVDLLAGLDDLLDGPAGDEGQRVLPDGVHVVGALVAGDAELGLLPDEAQQVAGREVLARGQPPGEPEERGAHHHRVVDVEEGGTGGVRGDRRWCSHLGGRGGGGAGDVCPDLLGGLRVAARGPAAAQRYSRHERPPCDRSPTLLRGPTIRP